MKKVSLALSDFQYAELTKRAKESNKTYVDYILDNLLDLPKDTKLNLNLIEERVSSLPRVTFKVRDLFSVKEWDEFTLGSKSYSCRLFKYNVINSTNSLYENIIYCGDDQDSVATYRKVDM